MNTDIPYCQADAVRRIRQVLVNGVPTGIVMLDESIAGVREMKISSDQQIKDILLKKVKVYNYIPKAAEQEYINVIFEEYRKDNSTN